MDDHRPHIIISGGNGFIGRRLQKVLAGKYRFLILTRNEKVVDDQTYFYWNPQKSQVSSFLPKNIFGIIHLAGAGIMDARWSASYKTEIIDSRLKPISALRQWMDKERVRPEVEIYASGIGFFGHDDAKVFHEDDKATSEDFLTHVCQKWEKIAHLSATHRAYIMRLGIVLDEHEGAFPKMKGPGPIIPIFGSGQQIFSWIHIDDLVTVFDMSLSGNLNPGTYNCVSPNAVSNIEMAESIQSNHASHMLLRIPRSWLSVMLGERKICLLNSTHASADRLCASGFIFGYPKISDL